MVHVSIFEVHDVLFFHSKNRDPASRRMLALETKQSGGKLLPHLNLWWGGSVSKGNIAQQAKRDESRDLGVDGWIILGWICRRWDVGIWTGLGWPRIETGGGRL